MNKTINLVSVDLSSGKSVFFSNKEDWTENEMLLAAVASASAPPLFPPVPLRNYYLVDGGVRDNVPIKKVIENWESDSVLVILCNKKDINKSITKPRSILGIGKRTIEIMMNEITDNDVEMAIRINDLLHEIQNDTVPWLADKKFFDIETIYPSATLSGTVLGFNHNNLRENFAEGVNRAKRYLTSI